MALKYAWLWYNLCMSVRDSGVTCALDKSDLQMLDDVRLTKIIKPDHYFTKFYSVNN